jgi:hypothetical protein
LIRYFPRLHLGSARRLPHRSIQGRAFGSDRAHRLWLQYCSVQNAEYGRHMNKAAILRWFLFLSNVIVAAFPLQAGNLPVWTATIPAPSFPGVVASTAGAISNSPSSTLVRVNCLNNQAPPNSIAGTQLVLLNGKGKVLATGEIAANADGTAFAEISVLSVTPRKLLLIIDGVPTQALVGPNQHLIFTPLPLETADETLQTVAGTADFDRRTLFSITKVSGLVTQVRRYTITRLKP